MNRGYIKLWRKSKDSGFLGNADVWQLLSWCLLNATHKPHKQIVGKQLVDLESGQMIFGRVSVAKQLNTTEKKIRTSLKLLESANFLSIKRASKYSVITIINWHIYQDEGPAEGQQTGQQKGQQGASRGPAEGHKQECKTQENKEEEIVTAGDGGKEYSAEFEEFWKSYPNKRGKKAALKAFEQAMKAGALPPAEQLLEIVERQKTWADWTKDGGKFIPHASTWLNGERWNDEAEEEPEGDWWVNAI